MFVCISPSSCSLKSWAEIAQKNKKNKNKNKRLLDEPRGLVCHLMLMVFPASQIGAAKRDYTVLSLRQHQKLLENKIRHTILQGVAL